MAQRSLLTWCFQLKSRRAGKTQPQLFQRWGDQGFVHLGSQPGATQPPIATGPPQEPTKTWGPVGKRGGDHRRWDRGVGPCIEALVPASSLLHAGSHPVPLNPSQQEVSPLQHPDPHGPNPTNLCGLITEAFSHQKKGAKGCAYISCPAWSC